MEAEMKEYFERLCIGVERLAEDPEIKMETHVPHCPHCGLTNPVVLVKESEAAGELGLMVIRATCENCSKEFVAIPFQMMCVKTTDEALEIQQRMTGEGRNDGDY